MSGHGFEVVSVNLTRCLGLARYGWFLDLDLFQLTWTHPWVGPCVNSLGTWYGFWGAIWSVAMTQHETFPGTSWQLGVTSLGLSAEDLKNYLCFCQELYCTIQSESNRGKKKTTTTKKKKKKHHLVTGRLLLAASSPLVQWLSCNVTLQVLYFLCTCGYSFSSMQQSPRACIGDIKGLNVL